MSGRFVNLGTGRAAAIGDQPAISGASLGDPGDFPIRGLGDLASAAPDTRIRNPGLRVDQPAWLPGFPTSGDVAGELLDRHLNAFCGPPEYAGWATEG
jgi:hypothetical protein